MAQAAQKITLSPSRDIPFDKLVLSKSNVRRIKAGVSVEELAEPALGRTVSYLARGHCSVGEGVPVTSVTQSFSSQPRRVVSTCTGGADPAAPP